MNALVNALNAETVETENGAKAYASTMDKNLDFFFASGSSRGKDITGLFFGALATNEDLAIRNLLWLRDVREGAGERKQFKDLLVSTLTQIDSDKVINIIRKIPEIGRYDDLQCLFGTKFEGDAVETWLRGIQSGNGLAAKWAPVKDKKGAKPLRKALGLNEHQWRKKIVQLRNTVEQQMCAKDWDSIEFPKVPSVAMSRYQTAFHRNCGEGFEKYKEALVKEEAKVNAGALYPYDLLKPVIANQRTWGHSSPMDLTVINKQWGSLPNYLEGSKENILPIVDVSGSMTCKISPKSETSCLDVAVSLGLYLSERTEGIFKNVFMTFSERPQLQQVTGTLEQRAAQMAKAQWGMSTDIQAVFMTLLGAALQYKVPQEEMPTKLLICSDMQFNQCVRGGNSVHFMTSIKAEYEKYGYKVPQIVFWQLNAREGGIPVTKNETGTALVSGFSPSIMKSLLKGDLEPTKVMLDTLMVDRYKI